MKRYQDDFAASERGLIQVAYRTYSDILFIVLPFLMVALIRSWNEEGIEILQYPDFSIITLILTGISLGKITLCLAHDKNVAQYRAYLSFAFALILSIIIAPSLLIITLTLNHQPMPDYFALCQPILLIVSITLYSISMNLSHIASHSVFLHR